MDGTRLKRRWFPCLQVHFPSKFRGLFDITSTEFFQRLPGQPPLQIHDEGETDESDNNSDDDE